MAEDIDLIEDENSEVRKRWKLEADLREAKAEIKRAKERADRAEARSKVVVAALAVGAIPDAEHLSDVVARIDTAGWTMKDGRPEMPGSTIGPDEWVKTLRGEAKHLFVQPGDALPAQPVPNGSGSSQVASQSQSIPTDQRNPWTEAGWDDMAQVALIRANPEKAKAMAAAAGSRVGALNPALAGKKAAF